LLKPGELGKKNINEFDGTFQSERRAERGHVYVFAGQCVRPGNLRGGGGGGVGGVWGGGGGGGGVKGGGRLPDVTIVRKLEQKRKETDAKQKRGKTKEVLPKASERT